MFLGSCEFRVESKNSTRNRVEVRIFFFTKGLLFLFVGVVEKEVSFRRHGQHTFGLHPPVRTYNFTTPYRDSSHSKPKGSVFVSGPLRRADDLRQVHEQWCRIRKASPRSPFRRGCGVVRYAPVPEVVGVHSLGLKRTGTVHPCRVETLECLLVLWS